MKKLLIFLNEVVPQTSISLKAVWKPCLQVFRRPFITSKQS